ncbi:MAG TPA: ribonuclease R [Pseudobdellovibrionaceae bacterium]|mgnify:CR=1 FL=1|nr:ribonuclease R [Pseudobdellovibrionaceae bacterium]
MGRGRGTRKNSYQPGPSNGPKSNSRREDRDSSRDSQREINNGRSLRDVLGGAASRSGWPRADFSSPRGESPRPSGGGALAAGLPKRSIEYKPLMSFPASMPASQPKKEASSPVGPRVESRPQPQTLKPMFKPPVEISSKVTPSEVARDVVSGGTRTPVDPGWPRARSIGSGLPTTSESLTGGPTPLKPGAGSATAGAKVIKKEARREGQRLFVTGTVKRHPDGFGFLLPDDASVPDVYISRQYMSGVMSNDRVEVEVFRSRPKDGGDRGERLFGEVKRILSRAHARVVGRYLPVDRRYGVIQDDGRGWGMDLRVLTEDSMGAQEGDWVAVEILEYASQDRPLTGRVVRILGDVEDPLNDIIRVIHERHIPDEFSLQAQREAVALGTEVRKEDCVGREDLRDLSLITIDGATARDFDDAVYVEPTTNGFRLIVAIADVSHYVKPGSAIDEDAYLRGTSVYFPNHVVPMLPEELSNELCSLKPEVDRLCFACEIQLDWQGVIRNYRFFEGVMRSQARVTYGEAQEVLDDELNDRMRSLPKVVANIKRCGDLAKILMAKRFREGSLDLELPETQVVVDDSGETTDIVRSTRLFAHRLIEELMLITNVCTARFFEDQRLHGIYRVHDEPDLEKIKTLERMMWNLLGPSGKVKGLHGHDLQKRMTKALQVASQKPGGQVLNMLALRAMSQAQYSEENIGHFGLGFSHYSHFTSPIRRYPDLIAHRLIKAVLVDRYRNQGMEREEIAAAAQHLSACEQRAVKAERQVLSIKKARFIRRYIGETLEGAITSVTKFGLFVTLRDFEVDGLLRLESLGNDRWVFDEPSMRLFGRRTGRVFKLGDHLRVEVLAADVSTGKIDFALASEAELANDDDVEALERELMSDPTQVEIARENRKAAQRGPGSSQGPQASARPWKGDRDMAAQRGSASKSRSEQRKGNKQGKPSRKETESARRSGSKSARKAQKGGLSGRRAVAKKSGSGSKNNKGSSKR